MNHALSIQLLRKAVVRALSTCRRESPSAYVCRTCPSRIICMELTQNIRPVVKLPCPAGKIRGRSIRFVPTRERIGELVKGDVEVSRKGRAYSIGAHYVSPIEPCHPDVYWFDQAEVDELFKA